MNQDTILYILLTFNVITWIGLLCVIVLQLLFNRNEKKELFRQLQELVVAVVAKSPSELHYLKEQIHEQHQEETVDNTSKQSDDGNEIIPIESMDDSDMANFSKTMLGR